MAKKPIIGIDNAIRTDSGAIVFLDRGKVENKIINKKKDEREKLIQKKEIIEAKRKALDLEQKLENLKKEFNKLKKEHQSLVNKLKKNKLI